MGKTIPEDLRQDLTEAREYLQAICQNADKYEWDDWAKIRAEELRVAATALEAHLRSVTLRLTGSESGAIGKPISGYVDPTTFCMICRCMGRR